jgi:hypothetical protein
MSMVGWMDRVSRSPEFTDITLGRNLGTSTLILSSGALCGASGSLDALAVLQEAFCAASSSISLYTSRRIASFKVKGQREMPQCHFLYKKIHHFL